MFLIHWIRTLFSLPLVWAGQLAGMIRSPIAAGLLTAAYQIGVDGHIGQKALGAIHLHRGASAAVAAATRWPVTAEMASFAGMLALETGDLSAANRFLQAGQAAGVDRSGLVDLLEYMTAIRVGDPGRVADVRSRLRDRHDLNATVSRMVLVDALWSDLLGGSFDEARRRSEHLLEVGDCLEADMALWTLATARADERRAQRHWQRAGQSPSGRAHYQALGYVALGRVDDARAMLAGLREANPSSAAHVEMALSRREGLV